MTACEVALALGKPERTVRRWLALWRDRGVRGIDVVPVRGTVTAYAVHPSVVRRYRAGALPVPHESTARPLAA